MSASTNGCLAVDDRDLLLLREVLLRIEPLASRRSTKSARAFGQRDVR